MGRPKELTEEERRALLAKGYRPVEVWVLDTDDPAVREDIRRQCAAINKADEEDDIEEWLEAVHALEEPDDMR